MRSKIPEMGTRSRQWRYTAKIVAPEMLQKTKSKIWNHFLKLEVGRDGFAVIKKAIHTVIDNIIADTNPHTVERMMYLLLYGPVRSWANGSRKTLNVLSRMISAIT
jgi:hypothetical protein